jgi:HU domain fused to wHTH, Ig, or Glycine-rich motif
MASRIKAIGAYRPRIELGNTVQKSDLLRAISRASNLTEGIVDLVVKELRDQIIEICRSGRALKVEEMGIFTPSIDLEGKLTLSFRPDVVFADGLNMPGTFSGTILNRENIGMTTAELVQMWNDRHPEDQVVFSEN